MRKGRIAGVGTVITLLIAIICRAEPAGILPTADDGETLNTDFEKGKLEGWTGSGTAFNGQPIRGDTVHARRADMHSNHAGNWWVGTYEVRQDGPRGMMTSAVFKVTHPYASFLIGGGSDDCRVEIVTADDKKIFYQASGDNKEDMDRVVADLRPIAGKKIFIRVVDDHRSEE